MNTQMEEHLKHFREVLEGIEELHVEKVTKYGLERYEAAEEDDFTENLWSTYYDLKRKMTRIRHMVHNEESLLNLHEELMDLVGYGIVGMQLIDRRLDAVREPAPSQHL